MAAVDCVVCPVVPTLVSRSMSVPRLVITAALNSFVREFAWFPISVAYRQVAIVPALGLFPSGSGRTGTLGSPGCAAAHSASDGIKFLSRMSGVLLRSASSLHEMIHCV